MTDLRDNRRGILAMVISMAAFNLSDAVTKLVTQDLPLGETIFLRGLIAATAIAAVVAVDGTWRSARHLLTPTMLLRIIGELGGTLFYLMALVHLALPNVSAVFQATPLAMTAAAAIFLGEKVGPRRWIAIAIGFVGVMIIVRPGLAGFEPASIWVLVSVAFVVIRDISTARLAGRLPTTLVTLVTAVAVTMLGPALLPFETAISNVPTWSVPTARQVGLLAVAASGLLIGSVLLIRATRLAETSAIAPYRYTLLVWAFLWGILLFGVLPDLATSIGGAVVVATGLYSFHRERIRAAERQGQSTP